MHICILLGSPRINGNTAELCKPFIDELRLHNAEVEYIAVHGKDIAPCLGCYHCQNIVDEYGCVQSDDMQAIVDSILKADVLVFATPVYTWQATPPLKAVMDRMYGLNKFYGTAPRSNLNAGQAYALIATCGYDLEYGAGLLDEGLRRWCEHSGLPYLGMYAVRDEDDLASFQTEAAIAGAREFAREIMNIRIETSRLILRPLAASDAAAVSRNSRQPSVARFMPDMVYDNEESAIGWIRWSNNELFDADKPAVLLGVIRKSDGLCIGCIFVHRKEEWGNVVEMGYYIADEYQNNGYATEAGKAMIWWAFDKAGQDMLSAFIKPENTASRRVVEKLGFIYVDSKMLPHDGADCEFDCFHLYNIDDLPGPEWDTLWTCETAEEMGEFFNKRAAGYDDTRVSFMSSGYANSDYVKYGNCLPETFDDLRLTIEKMSPRPEVFVANIGSTVKNKPRVDFAMGFFEPAGFICSTNDGFSSVEEAIEQITNHNHKSQIQSSSFPPLTTNTRP